MRYAAKTLLILGFVIAVLQVSFIGLMLFGFTPVSVAVVIKIALFGCIGVFALTAVRMVRRA